MIYDNPIITYDGAPTDAFFAQLLAKVEATPLATVTALQATTIPVNIKQVNSVPIKGSGVVGDTWGPV